MFNKIIDSDYSNKDDAKKGLRIVEDIIREREFKEFMDSQVRVLDTRKEYTAS